MRTRVTYSPAAPDSPECWHLEFKDGDDWHFITVVYTSAADAKELAAAYARPRGRHGGLVIAEYGE